MKLFKQLFIGMLVSFGLFLVFVFVGLASYSADLPNLDSLVNYRPKLITTIYDRDGNVLASYAEERRIYMPPDQMPKNVVNAFLAAEDDSFYSHMGINPITILRAAYKNFMAGATVQGGSTITQQVAKSFLLTPEKSYERKIKEMLLSFRIEKALSKDQILNLYLNHIFLGQNSYGVEAAAMTYFGKAAKDLSIAEAAVLAALPRAPSRDNPIVNPKAAKARQRYVLGRMLETHKISKSQYEDALKEELKILISPPGISSKTPYLAEFIRRQIVEKYGEERVAQGLSVYTTVKLENQLAAQAALDNGLRAADKRLGLRQPEKSLKKAEIADYTEKQHRDLIKSFYNFTIIDAQGERHQPVAKDTPTPLEIGKNYKGVVVDKDKASRSLIVQIGNRKGRIYPEEYRWALEANPEEVYGEKVVRNPYIEFKTGDIITVQVKLIENEKITLKLEQEPLVQGALISYDVRTGNLEAIVGGYDFNVTGSHFNRAIQAIRQPGSTFKPFVYGAALEAGLTPSTIIVDSPIVYRNQIEQSELETFWKPGNYGEKFYGDTTLRNALAFSRNIPTIKLAQYLKIPTVIDFARRLGVQSKLAPDLSLALGSSGMSLNEMVRSWSVFANKGRQASHMAISKVTDWEGNVLEENAPIPFEQQKEVLDPKIAFLMTSLLQSVVQYGTGQVVQSLDRPVAGKTGTTNDFKDAWFIGYTPQQITGVWVGFDEDRPIGRNETGTRTAAPIWLAYSQESHKNLPKEEFTVPEGIIQVKIDAQTGDVPTKQTQKVISEYFVDGNAPGQVAKPDENSNIASLTNQEPRILRTQIITGNPDLSSSRPNTETERTSGMDELLREDL